MRALTNHDDFEQAQTNCHDDKHKVNWDHPTWFWSCSIPCSSVHLATPSVLQTTSGTDYAASSLLQSPLPVPGVVLSIQMPTAYMHLIRMLPEPELDDKGQPKLQLKTEFPAVGTALQYYKHFPEDKEEDKREGQGDVPPGEMEELGEMGKGTCLKLKTDWKSNPHAKTG